MITKEEDGRPARGCAITYYLPEDIRSILNNSPSDKLREMEEFRLRACKPLMLHNSCGDWFVDSKGNILSHCKNPFIVRQAHINKTLELISENSLYAYQDEIKQGFITLKGGHRVGIAGRIVLDGNSVKNIKDVSGLNIRQARQVKGCSFPVLGYVLKKGKGVYNTLIISPPQCGKTTLLRDITRIISEGSVDLNFRGVKVGLVDERSEIASCYKGVPQNDVGLRTDVLDGCPKALGMTMMLRSMSPQVIVTDEIGNMGDKEAVMQVINAGVKILTTAHGYNISDLETREEVLSLIKDRVFERYIVLSCENGPGTLHEVVDGSTMELLFSNMSKTRAYS